MTSVSNISNNSMTPQQAWTGVDGRLWRWSIGRVSSAVKVPVALLGGLFQLGKMAVKTVALPISYIAYLSSHKADEDYKGSWSLRGIAIDGITSVRLIKGAAQSLINAVMAPNEEVSKKGWNRLLQLIDGGLLYLNKNSSCARIFKSVFGYQNPRSQELESDEERSHPTVRTCLESFMPKKTQDLVANANRT